MKFISSPSDLERLRQDLIKKRKENKTTIALCAGTGCLACGCEAVASAFRDALKQSGLEEAVELKTTGCHGFCERGPLVVIQPGGIFYQKVRPTDVKLIIDQTIKGNQIIKRLLYRDPQSKQTIVHEADIPFYKKQMRLIFGKNGFMDPTSIDDYIALGGYMSVAKALSQMQPE